MLVDSWSEEYVQNNETGETELVEKYLGISACANGGPRSPSVHT